MRDEFITVSLLVSVTTQKGWSPLMVAVSKGRTEVVSLLLEAGANTDLQTNVGKYIFSVCSCSD